MKTLPQTFKYYSTNTQFYFFFYYYFFYFFLFFLFKNKFTCKTNFLQFYQVVSAIPKHLVTKAKSTVPPESELCIENSPLFQLDNQTAIHLGKAKTKDFYCLFNTKFTRGVKLAQQNGTKQCTWMERHGKKYLTP